MIVIPNDWPIHVMQDYLAKKPSGVEALRMMCKGKIGAIPAKLVDEIEAELITNINDIEPQFKKIIRIGRRWYGFNPNLEDIKTGELVDIDTLVGEGLDANVHKILSILYRPLDGWWFGKYRIKAYQGWTEKSAAPFRTLPWSYALGVSAFFLDLGLDSMNSLVQSLAAEVEQMKSDNYQSDGDGTTQ